MPEELAPKEAKGFLREAIASSTRGGEEAEVRLELAKACSLETVCRVCPSFRAFRDDLRHPQPLEGNGP